MLTPQERIKEIVRINTSAMLPKDKLEALGEFVKQEKAEEEKLKQNEADLQSKSASQKIEISNPSSDLGSVMWSLLRGDKGETGEAGAKGEQGDKGEEGSQGIQGIQGLPGQKGDRGLDGKNGTNGKDGKNGVDGKDAEQIEINAIVKKVLKSLPKNKLHIKNIDGIDKFQEQIVHHAVTQSRGLLYAGLSDSKIKAGTNITISTAPDGTVTINSTGGGGGGYTVETPTGTIDDSNTTFTVTATPVYIVSDGTTYFNNAGFTLSGLTVTMAVAPTGYIRSFHS